MTYPTSVLITVTEPLDPNDYLPESKKHIETLWQRAILNTVDRLSTLTAYTATITPDVATIPDGMSFWWSPPLDSGANPTLRIYDDAGNAVEAARQLAWQDSSLVEAEELQASSLYLLTAWSGQFRVMFSKHAVVPDAAIPDDSVALAKLTEAAQDHLLARVNHTGTQAVSTVTGTAGTLAGRHQGTDGTLSAITVGTGLELTTPGALLRVKDNDVGPGKLGPLTAKRLLGRATNTTGAGEQISVGVGLEITDAGVLRVLPDYEAFLLSRSNHTGTVDVSDLEGDITLAMMEEIAAKRLLGRATNSSGIPEQISVGNGLEVTDPGVLQVTAAYQAFLLSRTNHTGNMSADSLVNGASNKLFLAADRTKLDGIAAGATANDTNASLRARASHTGTQAVSTILGLQGALDDLDAADATTVESVTAEAAARVAADETLGVRVDKEQAWWPWPGIKPHGFTTSIAAGDPAGFVPIDPAMIGTTSEGPGYRMVGNAILAAKYKFPVEPDRRYRVTVRGIRQIDSADPLNDAVMAKLALYGQTRGPLAYPNTELEIGALAGPDGTLSTSDGPRVVSVIVSRQAGDGVDFVLPAATRFVTPFAQSWGSTQETRATVIDWREETASVYSPDLTALQADVTALEAIEAELRLSIIETAMSIPKTGRYQSRSAAIAATVPASVDLIETLSYSLGNSVSRMTLSRSGSNPGHDLAFQSADGSWWNPKEPLYEPRHGGEIGVGADRAAFARLFDMFEANGGGYLFVPPGTYTWESATRLAIPSKTTIYLARGAKLYQPATGDAGLFSLPAGTENVSILGPGRMVGPYESITPVPTGNYPDAGGGGTHGNCAIEMYGDVRDPVRNVTIDGPEFYGWGDTCIFAESVDDLSVVGGTRLMHTGRDGVRSYGCDRLKTGFGLHIEDLGPGFAGVPPLLNCYGITHTRRPTRTTRLLDFDDLSTGSWTLGATTVDADAVEGSYTDALGVQAMLDKLIETATTATHQIRQDVTLDPTVVNTGSYEAKAAERSILRLSLMEGSSDGVRAHFDLAAGTVLVSGAFGDGVLTEATIEDVGNDIYRCRLVGIANITGTECRWIAQILDSAVALLDAGTYTGDGTSGLYLGDAQLIEGNRDWYGNPYRQFPPTRNFICAGGTVKNHLFWTVLDTHGGVHGAFLDWHMENVANAIGIDAGNTSGMDNAMPTDIHIDGITATRGTAETGLAFIMADANDETFRGKGLRIGRRCYGKGFGGAVTQGALQISYFDDIDVDCPTLEDCDGAGLYSIAGPVTGRIGLNVINLTGTPVAAIVINHTKPKLELTGGRIVRTTGTMSAFSFNQPDAGYSLRLGDGWSFEGTMTRWDNTTHIGYIAPDSPMLDRMHASARIADDGVPAWQVGLDLADTMKIGTGQYRIDLATDVTMTNQARVLVTLRNVIDARSATIVWNNEHEIDVLVQDAAGDPADNEFEITVRSV